MDDVGQRVISVVALAKKLSVTAVSLNSSLAELGFDSLDTINLMFDLESEFNISIPDEQARSIRYVGEIADGIRLLLSNSAAGV
ncbi:MAG: phosphopantetheine-binding protein [Terriglobales bacterium]